MAKKTCSKCGKTMEDTAFYSSKDGQKDELCKDCLTLHVDNFDPDSFVWILERLDFPYVPSEWNAIRDKEFAKKGRRMNGKDVIGKYLSKMRLNQFKKYRYADSAAACQEIQLKNEAKQEQQKAFEEKAKADFEKGQITEAQYKTLVSTTFQKQHQYLLPDANDMLDAVGADNKFRQEFFMSEEDLPNPAADLTNEDKQYLAMKWGTMYKPNEWVTLQVAYTEMMNSFDIQDADSKNTLIFICKTYLKMNQAIDIGDIESYQKLSRVYDQLRKSMKVTAAQKKEEETDFVDSVGELVAFCQREGGRIPEFNINVPLDKVDIIINDLKTYTRDLIYEDKALARQIQDYIKEARASAEKKRDHEKAKEEGQEQYMIKDEDILDYKDFLSNESSKDKGGEDE